MVNRVYLKTLAVPSGQTPKFSSPCHERYTILNCWLVINHQTNKASTKKEVGVKNQCSKQLKMRPKTFSLQEKNRMKNQHSHQLVRPEKDCETTKDQQQQNNPLKQNHQVSSLWFFR